MTRKSKYVLRTVAGFAALAVLSMQCGKVTGTAETILEFSMMAAILFATWSLLRLDKLEREEFKRLQNAPFKRGRGRYGQ